MVRERTIYKLPLDCYGEGIRRFWLEGLPITLQSKPGFAVWDIMMLSGEGKHADKYDAQHALRRCSGYMLVHLSYWLVLKSKRIDRIRVAVCGSKCSDMGEGRFADMMLSCRFPP